MSFETIRFRPLICLLALALLPAIPGPAAAETAASLALDTTWRGGPLRDGADRFRLDVPEPGLLTLHVSAPVGAETLPTVEVLGDVERLYQSPASLVMAVPAAGAIFVAVAPEDPERPLERYQLRNAFTACAASFPLPGTLPGFDKDVEERREEDDPWAAPGSPEPALARYRPLDAFTFTACAASFPLPGALPGFDKDVEERREEDDPWAAPQNPAPALERYQLRNAFAACAGSFPLAGILPGFDKVVAERREEDDLSFDLGLAACLLDPADDHADMPLCATLLEPGRSVGGELDNAFGDDQDYFTFVLAGQQTVEIAAAGEDEGVLGVLYDGRGQRLTAGGGQQLDPTLRIVRALSAGRYFVRVESLHVRAGSYSLSVTPLKSF